VIVANSGFYFTWHTFQELWGPDYSSVFSATMSYNRFVFLLSHLRLDNAAVCEEARKHDKFAAARKVENSFGSNIILPLIDKDCTFL
jgi:hypothetical protein